VSAYERVGVALCCRGEALPWARHSFSPIPVAKSGTRGPTCVIQEHSLRSLIEAWS